MWTWHFSRHGGVGLMVGLLEEILEVFSNHHDSKEPIF